MTKKIIYTLLFVPVIVLAGVMLRLNYMSDFKRVNITVRGYDPKDFFSGYYMSLRPDWEQTDCSQFADNICPQKDFDDYYHFYINESQSQPLEMAVGKDKVELVFSYSAGFEPIIVDLLVNGESYIKYLNQQ